MNTEKLIGAWSLISSIQSRNDVISKTFGDPPSGQIQYTSDGHMSAFLMEPDWARTGKNAVEESDRFFAYAGRWEINGNKVSHYIEFCSAPKKIGTTFVRYLKFLSEDEIELTTERETTQSGNCYQTKLIWRRHLLLR
ncbi:lipocalin-like domain-containing protein [Desulforhopalus singaporensis]|uniref:Lipocalin-like domain-containing protein n=1 Tax=Desulforhopalus singaporensis TaxID=91360 RepID=A0A1H0TEU9_9BACT|nr:lipocalin-like domain-containing protein [Desulforhopalus singaporensis]SDP52573.1 Lipocalin-like domain-containing protein [Desulforhopalus singaporensis]